MASVRETIQRRIDNLTLAELKEYISSGDPLMWIGYNILDVLNLDRGYAEIAEGMLDETIEESSEGDNK